jgi:hypothetical protein
MVRSAHDTRMLARRLRGAARMPVRARATTA